MSSDGEANVSADVVFVLELSWYEHRNHAVKCTSSGTLVATREFQQLCMSDLKGSIYDVQ